MRFTQSPPPFAPLAGRLEYAVEHDTPATIDIRIIRATDGTLLGAKRFAATDHAEFDIAPYLRSTLRFSPTTGKTGLYSADDRTVTAIVEATAEDNSGEKSSATSEACTFLSCSTAIDTSAWLTTLPASRLIPAGAAEELTLLAGTPQTITVTARSPRQTTTRHYPIEEAGIHLFRLDTCDFPEAEMLIVDAETCGRIVYSVCRPPSDGVRIAWRSSAGSIEHYTFPIESSALFITEKQRAYGTDGHTALIRHERRRTLRSALEIRAMLEALAEIAASPEVWLVENEEYTPVDVAAAQHTVYRHGALSAIEIEIRPKYKTLLPWN